jgi:hypothetical protein
MPLLRPGVWTAPRQKNAAVSNTCFSILLVPELFAMCANAYGFKQITLTNLAESDFGPIFPTITEASWVEGNLKPVPNPNVPKEVAALLEVARGCLIYGWFYYPLLTLGTEQAHRVLETAARVRCKQFGIPITRLTKKGKRIATTFADNIQALVKRGAISSADESKWISTRKLRNWASHPDQQTIITPGMASADLRVRVELLNKLFP